MSRKENHLMTVDVCFPADPIQQSVTRHLRQAYNTEPFKRPAIARSTSRLNLSMGGSTKGDVEDAVSSHATAAAAEWRKTVLVDCQAIAPTTEAHIGAVPATHFTSYQVDSDRGPLAIDAPQPKRLHRDADPREMVACLDICTPPPGGLPWNRKAGVETDPVFSSVAQTSTSGAPPHEAGSHAGAEDCSWMDRYIAACGAPHESRRKAVTDVLREFTEEATRFAVALVRKTALNELSNSGVPVVSSGFSSTTSCANHVPRRPPALVFAKALAAVKKGRKARDAELAGQMTDAKRIALATARAKGLLESDADSDEEEAQAEIEALNAFNAFGNDDSASLSGPDVPSPKKSGGSFNAPAADGHHAESSEPTFAVAVDADIATSPKSQAFTRQGIRYEIVNSRQRVALLGSHDACLRLAHHKLSGTSAVNRAAVPNLNVPPLAVIEYAGYRVVCTAVTPTDIRTLVYGSDHCGGVADLDPFVRMDAEAIACAKRIGESLNLRGHYCGTGAQRAFLYTNGDFAIHRGFDNRLYAVSGAERLVPPVITNHEAHPNGYMYRLMRPELAVESRKSRTTKLPLSSDAFSPFGLVRCEEYDREAALITELLRRQLLLAAADRLVIVASGLADVDLFTDAEGHSAKAAESKPRRRGTSVVMNDRLRQLRRLNNTDSEQRNALGELREAIGRIDKAGGVASILHRSGVNCRYMGEIVTHLSERYYRLKAGQDTTDTAAALKPLAFVVYVLRLEMVARTAKVMVRQLLRERMWAEVVPLIAACVRVRVKPPPPVFSPEQAAAEARNVADDSQHAKPEQNDSPDRARGKSASRAPEATEPTKPDAEEEDEETKLAKEAAPWTYPNFFEDVVMPMIEGKFGRGENVAISPFTPASLSIFADLNNGRSIDSAYVLRHIASRCGLTLTVPKSGGDDDTRTGVSTAAPTAGAAAFSFSALPIASIDEVAASMNALNCPPYDDAVLAFSCSMSEPAPIVRVAETQRCHFSAGEEQHYIGVARGYVRSVSVAFQRGYLDTVGAMVCATADRCALYAKMKGLSTDEMVSAWLSKRVNAIEALQSNIDWMSLNGQRERIELLQVLAATLKRRPGGAVPGGSVPHMAPAAALGTSHFAASTVLSASSGASMMSAAFAFPNRRTGARVSLNTADDEVSNAFGYRSGQRIEMHAGPSKGKVFMVLGLANMLLWGVELDEEGNQQFPVDGSFVGCTSFLGLDEKGFREVNQPTFFNGDGTACNLPLPPPEAFTVEVEEPEEVKRKRELAAKAAAAAEEAARRSVKPNFSPTNLAKVAASIVAIEEDEAVDDVGPEGILRPSATFRYFFGSLWKIRRYFGEETLRQLHPALRAGHRVLLASGTTALVLGERGRRLWIVDERIEALPRALSADELETIRPLHRVAAPAYNEGRITVHGVEYMRSVGALMRYGVLAGHKLVFTRGPLSGMVAFVVGTVEEMLCVANARSRELFRVIARSRKDFLADHGPVLVGCVADIGRILTPPPAQDTMIETITADRQLVRVDARASSLLPTFGVVHGSPVKVVLGPLAGLVGVTVGCDPAFDVSRDDTLVLWIQPRGIAEDLVGAVAVRLPEYAILAEPLAPTVQVTNLTVDGTRDRGDAGGDIEDVASLTASPASRSPISFATTTTTADDEDDVTMQDSDGEDLDHALAAGLRARARGRGAKTRVLHLAACGVPLHFDIREDVCGVFGLFSGQRIQLARDLFAGWATFTVLGVYRGELWAIQDGEASAVPLLGSNGVDLTREYAVCDVVGHREILPFHDPLCIANTTVNASTKDLESRVARRTLTVPSARLNVVGVDRSDAAFERGMEDADHPAAAAVRGMNLRAGDVVEVVHGARCVRIRGGAGADSPSPGSANDFEWRTDGTRFLLLGWFAGLLFVHGTPIDGTHAAPVVPWGATPVDSLLRKCDTVDAAFSRRADPLKRAAASDHLVVHARDVRAFPLAPSAAHILGAEAKIVRRGTVIQPLSLADLFDIRRAYEGHDPRVIRSVAHPALVAHLLGIDVGKSTGSPRRGNTLDGPQKHGSTHRAPSEVQRGASPVEDAVQTELPPENMPRLDKALLERLMPFAASAVVDLVDLNLRPIPFTMQRVVLVWMLSWFKVRLGILESTQQAKRLLAAILQFHLPGFFGLEGNGVAGPITLETLIDATQTALGASEKMDSSSSTAVSQHLSTAVDNLRAAVRGVNTTDGGVDVSTGKSFRFPSVDDYVAYRTQLSEAADASLQLPPDRLAEVKKAAAAKTLVVDGGADIARQLEHAGDVSVPFIGLGAYGAESFDPATLKARSAVNASATDAPESLHALSGIQTVEADDDAPDQASHPEPVAAADNTDDVHDAEEREIISMSADDVKRRVEASAREVRRLRLSRHFGNKTADNDGRHKDDSAGKVVGLDLAEASMAFDCIGFAAAEIEGRPGTALEVFVHRLMDATLKAQGALALKAGGSARAAQASLDGNEAEAQASGLLDRHRYDTVDGRVLWLSNDRRDCGDVFGVRRGDVFRYEGGDLTGAHLVILGVCEDGLLWRYEQANLHATKAAPSNPASKLCERAIPFAAINGHQLRLMHHIEKVGETTPRISDVFYFPKQDQSSVTCFDIRDVTCMKFGVRHGCRYACRRPPADLICAAAPNEHRAPLVVTAIGSDGDNIFFAIDHGGAFTHGGDRPVEELGLQPIYKTTVQSFGSSSQLVSTAFRCPIEFIQASMVKAKRSVITTTLDASPALLSLYKHGLRVGDIIAYTAAVEVDGIVSAVNKPTAEERMAMSTSIHGTGGSPERSRGKHAVKPRAKGWGRLKTAVTENRSAKRASDAHDSKAISLQALYTVCGIRHGVIFGMSVTGDEFARPLFDSRQVASGMAVHSVDRSEPDALNPYPIYPGIWHPHCLSRLVGSFRVPLVHFQTRRGWFGMARFDEDVTRAAERRLRSFGNRDSHFRVSKTPKMQVASRSVTPTPTLAPVAAPAAATRVTPSIGTAAVDVPVSPNSHQLRQGRSRLGAPRKTVTPEPKSSVSIVEKPTASPTPSVSKALPSHAAEYPRTIRYPNGLYRLCLFDATPAAVQHFGLLAGDLVKFWTGSTTDAASANFAIVLGVRDGRLWKIDLKPLQWPPAAAAGRSAAFLQQSATVAESDSGTFVAAAAAQDDQPLDAVVVDSLVLASRRGESSGHTDTFPPTFSASLAGSPSDAASLRAAGSGSLPMFAQNQAADEEAYSTAAAEACATDARLRACPVTVDGLWFTRAAVATQFAHCEGLSSLQAAYRVVTVRRSTAIVPFMG